MNKHLLIAVGLFFSFSSFSQINWQKGGNSALPPGSPPTIGTNYNSFLQFETDNTIRATLMGTSPGGGSYTGALGIGTSNPFAALHIFNIGTGLNDPQGRLFRTDGLTTQINTWSMFTQTPAGVSAEKFRISTRLGAPNQIRMGTVQSGSLHLMTRDSVRVTIRPNTGNVPYDRSGFVGFNNQFPAFHLDINTQDPNDNIRGALIFRARIVADPKAMISFVNISSNPALFIPTLLGMQSANPSAALNTIGSIELAQDTMANIEPITRFFSGVNYDPTPALAPSLTIGRANVVENRRLFGWYNGVDQLMTMEASGFLGVGLDNPGNRVEINSDFYTPGTTIPNGSGIGGSDPFTTDTTANGASGVNAPASGFSGLRFSDLTAISIPQATNPGTGLLAVDSLGDVIYIDASNLGGFGTLCSDTSANAGALAGDTKINMNNHNIYFENNDSLNVNQIGVGYDCGNPLPSKLSVYQAHPVALAQHTIAISAHNEDVAIAIPRTFTGVKALVNGFETLPRVEHIGGEFTARNAQLNYGIRSFVNSSAFVGATDYGVFTEVNDPNSLATFGTWSTGQGGSNSNWGVYATAAPRPASLGGSAVGYGGRFATANHYTRNVGVWGVAADPFPTTNHTLSACFGVAGIAQNGASNYGVYGEAGTSGTNNAGYFTGNVLLTGAPLVVSDAQFKTDVETLPNGLKLLTQLKPKTYYMDSTNFERMNFDRSRQFGFIAQDVAQVLPGLVKTNIHPAELDSNGVEISPAITYQSLNYNAIIPINTQAIIELNEKVNKATLSDESIKTNVQDLNGSLDKVLLMHGISYDWNHNIQPQLNLDSNNHIGFIAQEMAQVDARLTYLDDDSLLHVEYDKVVPVLAEAIEELNTEVESRDSIIATQQSTINDLNNRLTQLENCLSGILPMLCQMSQSIVESNTIAEQEAVRTQLSVQLSNRTSIVLDQNVPNPFAEQTVINFSIPATVQKAQIHFYDGLGKLIQSVDVVERGLGSLTVFGSDLSKGTYTYTLVADGQIVSTKKMMKQ